MKVDHKKKILVLLYKDKSSQLQSQQAREAPSTHCSADGGTNEKQNPFYRNSVTPSPDIKIWLIAQSTFGANGISSIKKHRDETRKLLTVFHEDKMSTCQSNSGLHQNLQVDSSPKDDKEMICKVNPVQNRRKLHCRLQ
ncbi:hypothetical protein H6P81_010881 [Aristolochia fimbriata]|uniref:Uncharacterized protein n=1 Tax=Aristolochia fimbriata TaxID=158543 RepID=A0AAV7ETH2_ARIFI|nr:hypothetical protein H6P81_010881 [Aristolochia fimbriata]